jgi:ATP/maltotriose-dependent transcriptional regulator MalT
VIERLAREDSAPIVSVVAPAGYGKTTLLTQWADRGGWAFAWVTTLRQAGIEESYVTPLVRAVQARAACTGQKPRRPRP